MQLSVKPKNLFLLHFWNLNQTLNILKKRNQPHSLGISEIIGYEKRAYLNGSKAFFL